MKFSGLSVKCKGILGNFIRPGSYHVLPRVELDEETGAEQAIIINDYMAVNSIKKDFIPVLLEIFQKERNQR